MSDVCKMQKLKLMFDEPTRCKQEWKKIANLCKQLFFVCACAMYNKKFQANRHRWMLKRSIKDIFFVKHKKNTLFFEKS